MARKTKTINLSLPQETYKQIVELSEQMAVSKSEVLRMALGQYVASEKRWRQIRSWGEETAQILNIKDEDDVDRIIHELRQEKA